MRYARKRTSVNGIPNHNLKEARLQLGLSQAELASKIGASQSFLVSRWESGNAFPTHHYRKKLSELFGKSMQELGLLPKEASESPDGIAQQAVPAIIPQSLHMQSSSYRGITGFPSLTDSRTIQQRQKVVEDISTRLTQPDVTALVLTGIGGVGKSTLAAFVYKYAEEQRRAGRGPFATEALWLTVNESVTLTDIANAIFEAFDEPVTDFSSFSPHNQALLLFNVLKSTAQPRLIVLDQFENLLDAQSGQALITRPGVGEWLDILNSQHCRCRVLLTSRPRPRGKHDGPLTCIQEYSIEGLDSAEGVSLLRKQGVKGTDAELQRAVKQCDGHAYALVLLASLLKDYNMSLTRLFEDATLWTEDIAAKLLDNIYKQQLNHVQHQLLQAFSIYREAVPLRAVQTIITNASKTQVLSACKALRTQHLIRAVGEGHFQVHAIIAEYVRDHFSVHDEVANAQARKAAHSKAAQYYLNQAAATRLPQNRRQVGSDVYSCIEAAWHYCRAGDWPGAYGLIEQEGLFSDLHLCGGDVTLLELYQLLLSIDNGEVEYVQMLNVYKHVGEVYQALGQLDKARECYERALQLCREERDQGGECKILTLLGVVYDDVGNRELAKEYYEQALTMSKALGDPEEEGRAHSFLGWICNGIGNRAEAREHLEQALSLFRAVNNRGEEAWTLNKLGNVYQDINELEQAWKYLQQALDAFREVGNRSGEAWALSDLGAVYNKLGQNKQAREHLEHALSLFRAVKGRRGEAWALCNLGLVYKGLEQSEQARACLEQALNLFSEIGDRIGESSAINRLGGIYHMLGQREQALMYYKQALHIQREIGDLPGEGETLLYLGFYYFEHHQYDAALASSFLAKEVFKKVQSPEHGKAEKQIETLLKEICS